jgi:hypothetical protein
MKGSLTHSCAEVATLLGEKQLAIQLAEKSYNLQVRISKDICMGYFVYN